MHAHRIGSTQTRAEVVRIGNAVQYQQKRRFAQVFQHIFQVNMVFGSIDESDHALMSRAFADGIQAVGIGKCTRTFSEAALSNTSRVRASDLPSWI